MSNKKVYLDTSSINYFFDYGLDKAKKLSHNFDIYFSPYHLDEIQLIKNKDRIKNITKFLWDISKKYCFKGKLSLAELETEALLNNERLFFRDYFFNNRNQYINCVREQIEGTGICKTKIAIKNINNTKNNSIIEQRNRRKKWNSKFDGKELPDNWLEMFRCLKRDKWFNKKLFNLLQKKYPENIIESLNYKSLECTSIALEYYGALRFVDESGLIGKFKPTRGDVLDICHIFYLGLVDYFVTDDKKMLYILKEMLDTEEHIVLNSDDFIKLMK